MKSLKYNLRPWQSTAKDELNKYWLNGGDKALLAACPGSGKTTFGVNVAIQLFNDDECDLCIVIAPTINVKEQWSDEFELHGFEVINDLDNDAIRTRSNNDESIVEDKEVICVTYPQLSAALPKMPKDGFIFSLYGKRYKLFLIGDEIHHADDNEKFGDAVERTAAFATKTLALSGTPFNTAGGSLSMCDSEMDVDDDGRAITRANPFHTYSYAKAMRDSVCRLIEFGVVYGKAKTEYKSLATGKTFEKLVDLAKGNKTDRLTKILDVDGEFMDTLLSDGIDALTEIKKGHKAAGMLIASQSKNHAASIQVRLNDILKEKGLRYTSIVIVNDTPQAHERIKALNNDGTDIVITVKMISEGVDVKRLRVGVYAINYLTRMFFVQFIGRFIRWQNELEASQFSRVIIPAHILLMGYAREIEEMCLEAVINPDGDTDPEGEEQEQTNVELENETNSGDRGRIGRSHDASDEDIEVVDVFRKENPSVASSISNTDLAEILISSDYMSKNRKAENASRSDGTRKYSQKWWRNKNMAAVRSVARLAKKNGHYSDDIFGKIQRLANKHVGIPKIDKLTPKDTLAKRHSYLKQMIIRLMEGEELV